MAKKFEITSSTQVEDLPPNDLDACQKFYDARGVTVDDLHVMYHLQDDDNYRKLIKMTREWKVRE